MAKITPPGPLDKSKPKQTGDAAPRGVYLETK